MKILVISLSNLGDAILTYPALWALWKAYPEAQFHVLAGPRTLELFASESRFQRVWVWEKISPFWKQAALITRLRFQRFRLVVDFRNSLIPLFLGARHTPILRRPLNGRTHRVEHHLALVGDLGIPVDIKQAPLLLGQEDERFFSKWIEPGQRVVVMAPGSRSHLKRWPAQRFASVADQLIAQEQVQIVLVGAPEDRPISEEIHSCTRNRLLDLTGQTTIRQTAALLARAQMLITNDSACLHAAEAMGTPTVAIFGPTDEKKYGPRNPRSIVVRRQLVCAPCERALCPYHHECLQQLAVGEVYAAAARILAGGQGLPR